MDEIFMNQTTVTQAEELPPHPVMVESMRHAGYSLAAALADIIDNSITAHATGVEVSVSSDPSDQWISILDNGTGMTEEELVAAMRLGSADPLDKRQRADLGRFGLGMKTASFSQCRKFTVVSRKGNITSARCWDLDYIKQKGGFFLQQPDISDLPGIDGLTDTGTAVIWSNLHEIEKNKNTTLDEEMSDACDELELTFHRFLSGEKGLHKVSISVNNRDLEAFDPFNSTNPATMSSPVQIYPVGEGEIQVQAFTLPHHSNLTAVEWEHYAGAEGYFSNQGFYVYREKRLIIKGTWFGLKRREELTKLTRVRVDILNDVDEEWGIDIKKSSAQLPRQIRDSLRRLTDTMGTPSKKVYRGKGSKILTTEEQPVWQREPGQGNIWYRINELHPSIREFQEGMSVDSRERFVYLLEMIGSALPVDSLFADISGSPEKMEPQEVSDEALRYMVESSYHGLLSVGMSHHQIVFSLKTSEPFSSRWTHVQPIIDSLGKGV